MKTHRFILLKKGELIDAQTKGRMSTGDFLPVPKRYHGEVFDPKVWTASVLGRLVPTRAHLVEIEAEKRAQKVADAAPELERFARLVAGLTPTKLRSNPARRALFQPGSIGLNALIEAARRLLEKTGLKE